MLNCCKSLGLLAIASLGVAGEARADVLAMSCKGMKNTYAIRYDTEAQTLARQDPGGVQSFKVLRAQLDGGAEALVWGVTRDHGGDVLVFFGSKAQVKWFYGNGSELTDECKPL